MAEGALKLSASGRVSTPELTNERIEELAALRALLEPELASRALPRAHVALIDRMAAINGVIDEMIVKGDASGYVRTNLEFHRTLYLRAQAPAMLGLIETVWLQAGPTMRMLYERLQRRQASDIHRKIIAALRAGDEPGLRLAIRIDVTRACGCWSAEFIRKSFVNSAGGASCGAATGGPAGRQWGWRGFSSSITAAERRVRPRRARRSWLPGRPGWKASAAD